MKKRAIDLVAVGGAVFALVVGVGRAEHDPIGATVLLLAAFMLAVRPIAVAVALRRESLRLAIFGVAAPAAAFAAILVIMVVGAIEHGDAAWFVPLLTGSLIFGVSLGWLYARHRRSDL